VKNSQSSIYKAIHRGPIALFPTIIGAHLANPLSSNNPGSGKWMKMDENGSFMGCPKKLVNG